nr:putative reverse transcriptase domain-containing protein [Tanacetum cinerariifolium]
MFCLYQLKYNSQHKGPLIFDDDQFEDELEMGDDVFVLIGKEVAPNSEIPEAMFPLFKEFSNVFPDADALPPLCDIQYHIDLEPGSQLPNMPHYRLCLETHEELRRQKVQDFVKGLPYHGVSSDDNLVGNSRTNFIYP